MPPCSRKKGAVNTPSESHFSKNENGGSDFYFKAAVSLYALTSSALNHLLHDGFFLLAVGQFIFYLLF